MVKGLDSHQASNWATNFAEGYIQGLELCKRWKNPADKALEFARLFVSEVVGKTHTKEFAYSYALKKIEDNPEEYCVIFAHFKDTEKMSDVEAHKRATIGLKIYEKQTRVLKETNTDEETLEDIALVYTMKILSGNRAEYAEKFSSCFGFRSIQGKSTEYKSKYAEGYVIAKKDTKKSESFSRAYARAYAKYRDQMTDLQARTLSAVIATDWTSNREELFISDLKQDGTESINRQTVLTCACGNSEKKQ